ncbi:MAG: 4Fe-4S dicluster domain-containing protein [Mycoplasmatales bacterium]
MAFLKNHELIIKEIREQIDYELLLNCMRCGLCINTCPTYKVFDRDESQSPRGRIALIRAVYDGLLIPDDEFKKALNQCIVCKKCMEVCPSSVKYTELLFTARNIIDRHT